MLQLSLSLCAVYISEIIYLSDVFMSCLCLVNDLLSPQILAGLNALLEIDMRCMHALWLHLQIRAFVALNIARRQKSFNWWS